jgi:histidinol phosphatase-like enzyme
VLCRHALQEESVRAVFVKQGCLLGSAEESPGTAVSIQPSIGQDLHRLAVQDLFVILMDAEHCGSHTDAEAAVRAKAADGLLEQVSQAGGQVDALLQCPHRPEEGCGCWGTYPGFLYATAARLELRLEECFLLCDEPNDVVLAYRVGCRPILVLSGNSIGDVYEGHQPEPRDFPIARNFAAAVDYVLAEDQTNELWGHARVPSALSQLEEEIAPADETPELSPTLRLMSPVPGGEGALLTRLPQITHSARRLLLLFVFGGVWLSLGIAYLLTHLYRVQPFPEFVWYLTLQFIPRPVRGALFIGTGAAVVILSLRAFLHLLPGNSRQE